MKSTQNISNRMMTRLAHDWFSGKINQLDTIWLQNHLLTIEKNLEKIS